MPKFDYIIQNPPYSGSLHLDFLKKGYELLSDNGKMVIIEPATWLINVRKTGKAKLYDEIKKMLGKHVYKVVIENMNKQFDTALYVPFSITYIDNKVNYDSIKLVRCGETLNVNNLYDCNLIGDYDMIWSILNKIKSYGEKVGTMKDHIYKEEKTKVNKETWFCKYADIMGQGGCGMYGTHGEFKDSDNAFQITIFGEYQNAVIDCFIHRNKNKIKNIQHKQLDTGGNEKDKLANQLYGSKQELENWKHFVFNNKIPLFTSIVLVISQNNRVKDIIPWLVDKKYTDDEIYQLLNITEEEQQFIDKIIKKYERHSPWFKRYMCGPDSVSDEEVQKFINIL